MIVWIASFPKSGNTWIRAFLSSYLYSDSQNNLFDFKNLNQISLFPRINHFKDIGVSPKNFEDVAKSWIPLQKKINSNNKVNFLKTHNAFGGLENFPFTNKENTLGAIYLVRDPRDVLVSYSKHVDQGINETLKLILENNHMGALEGSNNVFSELRASWSQNYNSWKNFNLGEKIIVRYEDLIEDPFAFFCKIINFLNKLFGLEFNEEKIRQCIKITDFNNLQDLEKKLGFSENIKSKELFFNKGKVGQWKKFLSDEIVKKIEIKFEKEMKELNYI